jgi:hypothetical protein
MDLKITPEFKRRLRQPLSQLRGASRRVFMTSVVKAMGRDRP